MSHLGAQRQADVSEIADALRVGRPVVVRGVAGIGKTTSLQRALDQVGLPSRWGAGSDFLQSEPFLPLVRALGRPPRATDPYEIAEEVMAEIGPSAVLVLDDLQWSDLDTLAVLEELCEHGRFAVATRPGTEAADRVLKVLDPIALVVDLQPLDDEDARSMVRAHWPGAPDDAVAAIVARSGGVPLVVSYLADEQTSGPSEAATDGSAMRAVVEALPPDALRCLARLGAGDTSVRSDEPGARQLVDARLASETDGWLTGTADLFGELALAALDPDARIAVHGAMAAGALDPGVASRHWLAAGDLARAHELACRAAAEASTPGVRAEAAELAARTAPSPDWALTREAVLALREVGRFDEVGDLVARLDPADAPTELDRLEYALMQAKLAADRGEWATTIELSSEALGRTDDGTDDQMVGWLLTMRAVARTMSFDLGGAITDAEAAIARAGVDGNPSRYAHQVLAMGQLATGDDAWVSTFSTSFETTLADGNANAAFDVGTMLASALYLDCRIEEGEAVVERLLGLAGETGRTRDELAVRAVHATNLAFVRPGDAEVVTELQGVVGHPATGRHRHGAAAALAMVLADRGDLTDAKAVIEQTRLRPQGLDGPHLRLTRWAEAEVAWAAGRIDDMVVAAAAVLEDATPGDLSWSPATALLRWARWSGAELASDPPWPLTIHRAFRPFSDECAGLDLATSQDAGAWREAAVQLRLAADGHEAYCRRSALRCRWGAAELAARAGDCEHAVEALRSLLDECRTAGQVMLERRVTQSLRRLGVHVGGNGGRGNDLTDRQLEVLLLVREGRSTGEIAMALGLRPSTVETHIREAIRRLGASNRREAALRVS